MIAPLRIGARLRLARERAGWTQAQLDAAAGLALGSTAHFEADRRAPSLATFRALCEALASPYAERDARRVAAALLGM